MRESSNGGEQDLIERVVAHCNKMLSADRAATIGAFIRKYYVGMAAVEISDRSEIDLYGAALSHWNFAETRRPGEHLLRVYNPSHDRHGWQSTHTVVDICTDDSPFLIDSLRTVFNNHGLRRYLLIHPVLNVYRDESDGINAIAAHDERLADARREAFIHFEIDRQSDPKRLEVLKAELLETLATVRLVVGDWRPMKAKLDETIDEIRGLHVEIPKRDKAEAIALLKWLGDDHFIFLGYRDYELERSGDEELLCEVPDSGLGILRNPGTSNPSTTFIGMSPEIRKHSTRKELLIPSKANTRSTIHRPGYHDYIGVKRFGPDGRVVGERRFVGLYTSTIYNSSVLLIPWIRTRVNNVLQKSPYPVGSHGRQAMLNILENYPRDELFHVDESSLYETAMAILRFQDHHQVGVFVHRERFGRFYSCLVYIPRDRFNTAVRNRVQQILESAFDTTDTEVNVQINESALARLYFVLRIAPDSRSDYDIRDLEQAIRSAARAWSDDLHDALPERFGEERGTRLLHRYQDAFKADYRENYSYRTALLDIEKIEGIGADGELAMTLYRPLEAAPERLNFRLFHTGGPVSLSKILEMLENMGLRIDDSLPNRVDRADRRPVWIYDFGMVHSEGSKFDVDQVTDLFNEAFLKIWHREAEDDPFNHLVLRAKLDWRAVVMLRAYSKYLHQIRVPFSQDYMQQTLCANPRIAALLFELFEARFNPQTADATKEQAIVNAIDTGLDGVAVLDQDRILRGFMALIRATLRTNYYQVDSEQRPKPYLSLKLDPQKIPGLPEPRPRFEVFVYSPRVEGVHLRGGAVARGGLRWSDRREDFRTEVLGLMKAQMVKNAVIVPVGAKGGFVPKNLPTDANRQAVVEEAKDCYRTFIRGLLDLTDNIVGDEITPRPRVVRHDADDTYLVVAADKGTATFSDVANEIAAEYDFWLGDAFASGGSVGYDHKAMGITARGAWESVRSHFRHLALNPDASDFTAIGIGDMSGDVFGNGMLLSSKLKLIGAFNQAHVFIDPNPDPAKSFAERQRLFDLPRSSWKDYDEQVISTGGGVFSRQLKSIPLSPQVRAALDIGDDELSPEELIRALLKAPVDLLWNGGIGTYVKSSAELNSNVGDRTNDAVRVNGDELRCKVLVEGGNLGCTQRGRIEYALKGGRLNTDSIDNSAGVDCSDHEVNIKILLNKLMRDGELTSKQRNVLLIEMTDSVADLVLQTNYRQNQALNAAAAQAPAMLDVHARMIDALESLGRLDRAIENLPDKEAIEERQRQNKGLTCPELAVLLSHAKLALYDAIYESDLPDAPSCIAELIEYFPPLLQQRFSASMPSHPLARQIICNSIVNEVVNRAGMTFVHRVHEETGARPSDIVRAYVIARKIFSQPELWRQVEALDYVASSNTQINLLLEGRKLVERATRWLLSNRSRELSVRSNVKFFSPGITELSTRLVGLLDKKAKSAMLTRLRRLMEPTVPETLASSVAVYHELIAGLDIVSVADLARTPVETVATIYYLIGADLDLHWVRAQIDKLPRDSRWRALARASLREDLSVQHKLLTADVLQSGAAPMEPDELMSLWNEKHRHGKQRCKSLIKELKLIGKTDASQLAAALREIRSLHRGELDVLHMHTDKQRADPSGSGSEAVA